MQPVGSPSKYQKLSQLTSRATAFATAKQELAEEPYMFRTPYRANPLRGGYMAVAQPCRSEAEV